MSLEVIVTKAEEQFFPWVMESLTVENDDQFKNISDVLGVGKSIKKSLETDCTEERRPHLEKANTISEEYKPVINRVQFGIDLLDHALIAYSEKKEKEVAELKRKQEEENRELQRKAELEAIEKMKANAALIEEAKETGEILPEDVHAPIVPTYEPVLVAAQPITNKVKGHMSTTNIKKTYTYTWDDPDEVERFLCSPDSKKIGAYHQSQLILHPNQPVKIKGITITENKYTSTRLG